MRKTEGCSAVQYLLRKAWGTTNQTNCLLLLSFYFQYIRTLYIWGWGDKRPSEPYQVLLLLPLLWEVNHTPYGELCRPKRSHLPISPKNVNFFNPTLPTAIILLNLGCPPPPQKGRTSVYNGLGNKNPIRDYQILLRK